MIEYIHAIKAFIDIESKSTKTYANIHTNALKREKTD